MERSESFAPLFAGNLVEGTESETLIESLETQWNEKNQVWVRFQDGECHHAIDHIIKHGNFTYEYVACTFLNRPGMKIHGAQNCPLRQKFLWGDGAKSEGLEIDDTCIMVDC